MASGEYSKGDDVITEAFKLLEAREMKIQVTASQNCFSNRTS